MVCDNCTDRTVEIAQSWGSNVSAFETSNNRARKAGALNQALTTLLPRIAEDAWIFVVDADSRPASAFVARALEVANANPKVGAVGGIFLAEGQTNLLGELQASEYARYAREIARDSGRARVLTGTATMTRVSALRQIINARDSGTLPGHGVYHAGALCEDFELTLALKRLGFACISPRECTVRTEVMDTTPMLWRQRMRWQHGAVQALQMHGVNRTTLPYISKQVQTAIGQTIMLTLLVLTAISIWSGSIAFQPFWFAVGMVFIAERIVSAWRAGKTNRILAALFIPDLIYDWFISAVFAAVWIQVAFRRQGQWGIASIDNTSEGS